MVWVVWLFLAASWLFFVWMRQKHLRRVQALHTEAQAFLQGKGKVSFGVEEDSLALLRDDMAHLAGQVEMAQENQQLHENQLRKLTAEVAHQFKTPLAGLRLYCEMDAEDLLPNAEKELALVRRMEEMIFAILRMEKLQANVYEMHFAQGDMAQLARDACVRFTALFPGKHFELPQGHVSLRFDAVWMREALENVIKNACEHTAVHGSICVSVTMQGPFCRIEVEDDGGGVAPDDLASLFLRFRSLGQEDAGGVGLGLAITKGIVGCHHGSIWAENGVRGLRIQMMIPVMEEELTAMALE